MNNYKNITWLAIYCNLEDPIYTEYKEMLQSFVPRYGSLAEVENEIFYHLTPLRNPERRACKKVFASMDELRSYLATTLFHLRVRREISLLETSSLDAEIANGLSALDYLAADPNEGREDACHAWMMAILKAASREKGKLGNLARLLLEDPYAGRTQAETAKILNWNQSTVNRYLKALRERVHQYMEL